MSHHSLLYHYLYPQFPQYRNMHVAWIDLTRADRPVLPLLSCIQFDSCSFCLLFRFYKLCTLIYSDSSPLPYHANAKWYIPEWLLTILCSTPNLCRPLLLTWTLLSDYIQRKSMPLYTELRAWRMRDSVIWNPEVRTVTIICGENHARRLRYSV